jgi:hypothetical protein
VKEGRWYDRAKRAAKSLSRKALIRIYFRRPRLFRRIRSLIHPPQDTTHEIYLKAKNALANLPAAKNDRLSELAHSRPALQVQPPAFFRHAVFFFPHIPRERNPTLYPGNFDRKTAMKRLGKLVAKLADRSEEEILNGLAERFESDESYILKSSFLEFDLRVVIDVYSEYATLTLVLDDSTGLLSGEAAVGDPTAIVAFIQEHIAARRTTIGADESEKSFESDYRSGEAVYFGIWELLNHVKGTRLSQSGIGTMVGDFRGFAICPSGCEAAVANFSDSNKPHRFVPGPEQRAPQDPLLFLKREQAFFLDCLGLNTEGSILHAGKSSEKRIEPNVILCRMLGGDGIYGSALGNRSTYRYRRVPVPYAPTPITYFVIHNGQSTNQLGRMIRRQNLLGELRIAALLDAETIMKLGAPIRRLSGLVSNLLTHGTMASSIPREDFDEGARTLFGDWPQMPWRLPLSNGARQLLLRRLAKADRGFEV